MKKIQIALISITLLFHFSLFSQENFEGILKFKIKIQDKTGKMSDEQSKMYMGTKQIYYLKGKKYKSELDGILKIINYHEGKDTLFTKINGADNLLYTITSKEKEKVISYVFKETDSIVLGYQCELLEVKTNKGYHQYYFNKDFKSDKENYKNHKLGLWSFFTNKTGGALSLISISDTESSRNYLKLTAIERKSLNDTIFIKPKNLKLVEIPEN